MEGDQPGKSPAGTDFPFLGERSGCERKSPAGITESHRLRGGCFFLLTCRPEV